MISQLINIKKMYNPMADWHILKEKLNEKILEEIDHAFQEADTAGYDNAVKHKIFLRTLSSSIPPLFQADRFMKDYPEI